MSAHASTPTSVSVEPFRGGGRWLTVGGLIGLVLLIVSLVGIVVDPKEAYYSYLVAFSYWGGIAVASVMLLMIFHATHARWMTVLRRPVEAMASSVWIFLLLFIPVILGMKEIYSWVDPSPDMGKEALKLLAHKAPWLNHTLFIVRAFGYLLIAGVFAWRLTSWSQRQDKEGGADLLGRSRRLSSGGLPFVALAITFAAFDWLMSLNPLWFSTIFGVYFFAGSFVSALSILAIVTHYGGVRNVFGGGLNIEHTHNIGKLMLAFVCFWTYVAFSQLLLIWIAGLPEEIPFYITRFKEGWAWIGVVLIFGNFFIPFGLLLSRPRKRNPRRLARVAVWILLVHYMDIYWLAMPTLHPDKPSFHWTSITAFFGVGLIAVAFGVSRLRGKLPVPVKDPYLAESLRYRQP